MKRTRRRQVKRQTQKKTTHFRSLLRYFAQNWIAIALFLLQPLELLQENEILWPKH